MTTPAPPPYGVPGDQPARRNGLGLGALLMGLLAVPGAFLGVPGIVLGVPAVVLGILARRRVTRRQATNPGQALAGLVLGSVSATLGVIILGASLVFFFSNREAIEQREECVAAAVDDTAREECLDAFDREIEGR